jgi:hypothetical protein
MFNQKEKFLLIFLILYFFSFFYGCRRTENYQEKLFADERTTQSNQPEINDNIAFFVKYEVSSPNETGTMKLYQKGDLAKIEMEAVAFNRILNTTSYFTADSVFVIKTEGENKKGFRMPKMETGKDELNILSLEKEIKNFDSIGTGKVMDYSCNIFKKKDETTIYFYKNKVILKITNPYNQQIIAKEFNPLLMVGDDFFIPPKNVKYFSEN